MQITPFLQNQAFDPETVELMSRALTDACAALGLRDRADQMTELIAEHIVELAQQGMLIQERARDPRHGRVQSEPAIGGLCRRLLSF